MRFLGLDGLRFKKLMRPKAIPLLAGVPLKTVLGLITVKKTPLRINTASLSSFLQDISTRWSQGSYMRGN